MSALYALAAGGSGGHLFPAEALARQLLARGHQVALLTDQRGAGFGQNVPGVETFHLAGQAVLGGGLIGKAQGLLQLLRGTLQAKRLLRRLQPRAVIGFGGYASVPGVLAAQRLGLATLLHEQNAVMGRANRLLAKGAKAIALSFPTTLNLPKGCAARSRLTGNPVRPAIAALAQQPYQAPDHQAPLLLLVFGGSQGAKVFNELVPTAVAGLPVALRQRLRVVQQVRGADADKVAAAYQAAGVTATLAPFFADLPDHLARASLVLCRSGASSVMELAAAGRPALLVPYPFAADDHQRANAQQLAAAGGAWVLPQGTLEPTALSQILASRLTDTDGLAKAAKAARHFAQDDAAASLAHLVEEVAA